MDFHAQTELPFRSLMPKQGTRIKYVPRAALCSAEVQSGMTRGCINLPPMIPSSSGELPIPTQKKQRDLKDAGREHVSAEEPPRAPAEA